MNTERQPNSAQGLYLHSFALSTNGMNGKEIKPEIMVVTIHNFQLRERGPSTMSNGTETTNTRKQHAPPIAAGHWAIETG
jgi:hypothetical protein